jgi:hypothetical protein
MLNSIAIQGRLYQRAFTTTGASTTDFQGVGIAPPYHVHKGLSENARKRFPTP